MSKTNITATNHTELVLNQFYTVILAGSYEGTGIQKHRNVPENQEKDVVIMSLLSLASSPYL